MKINDVVRDFILESEYDVQRLAESAATLKVRYEKLAEEKMVLEEKNRDLEAQVVELLIEQERAKARYEV